MGGLRKCFLDTHWCKRYTQIFRPVLLSVWVDVSKVVWACCIIKWFGLAALYRVSTQKQNSQSNSVMLDCTLSIKSSDQQMTGLDGQMYEVNNTPIYLDIMQPGLTLKEKRNQCIWVRFWHGWASWFPLYWWQVYHHYCSLYLKNLSFHQYCTILWHYSHCNT